MLFDRREERLGTAAVDRGLRLGSAEQVSEWEEARLVRSELTRSDLDAWADEDVHATRVAARYRDDNERMDTYFDEVREQEAGTR